MLCKVKLNPEDWPDRNLGHFNQGSACFHAWDRPNLCVGVAAISCPGRDHNFSTIGRKGLKVEAALRNSSAGPTQRPGRKARPFGQQTRHSANETPCLREVSRRLTIYEHEPRPALGYKRSPPGGSRAVGLLLCGGAGGWEHWLELRPCWRGCWDYSGHKVEWEPALRAGCK